MSSPKRTLRTAISPIVILPAIHLLLCAITALLVRDNGWGWVPVMALDIPVVTVMEWFKRSPYEISTVVVFGTLQWFCVGVLVSIFSKRPGHRKKSLT